MLDIARLLADARPDRANGASALAAATRHLRGPGYALGILMEAVEDYPDEAAIYYSLSCCEATPSCLDNARLWLKEALKLVPGPREAAPGE